MITVHQSQVVSYPQNTPWDITWSQPLTGGSRLLAALAWRAGIIWDPSAITDTAGHSWAALTPVERRQYGSSYLGVQWWQALGAVGGATPTATVAWPGSGQPTGEWHLIEVSGLDATPTVGEILQSNGLGTLASAGSLTLASGAYAAMLVAASGVTSFTPTDSRWVLRTSPPSGSRDSVTFDAVTTGALPTDCALGSSLTWCLSSWWDYEAVTQPSKSRRLLVGVG